MKKLLCLFTAVLVCLVCYCPISIFAEESQQTNMLLSTTEQMQNYTRMIVESNYEKMLEECAMKVTEADIALYGEEIDEVFVLYDAERGIDLLGVTRAYNNGEFMALATMDYGKIYTDCFTNVTWINRDGIWSLSVYHTFNGLLFNGGHTGQTAFEALAYFRSGIEKWPSSATSSMRNQFQCHVDIARNLKNPYNLEPSTPDKGYAGFVLSGCN